MLFAQTCGDNGQVRLMFYASLSVILNFWLFVREVLPWPRCITRRVVAGEIASARTMLVGAAVVERMNEWYEVDGAK